ncbi:MAG: sugar transferase [Culicoidibacterales bacterium]
MKSVNGVKQPFQRILKMRYQKIGKRAIDVVVGTILLIVIIPISIVVSILIKYDSPGPIFYRQERVGKHQTRFILYKFRTMANHAEERQVQLKSKNEANGPFFKVKADPRITKVGGILRKYSIDELPQLMNVLKGEMSLIGPRPMLVDEIKQFEPWMNERFAVLPGITGLWQITTDKNELPFREWLNLDISYVKKQSFSLDSWIFLQTIKVVLTHQNE